MAFVAGVKRTVGDVLTAAQWNDYYGANTSIDFLKSESDLMTAMRQTVTANAKNTNILNGATIRLITVAMSVASGDNCDFRIGSSSPPGTPVVYMENQSPGTMVLSGTFLVPPNWYYRVASINPTVRKWTEWDWHVT
tara:strand:- start:2099 stop:2509 length:411 start_codon:yes stop_codon:yes gene_type:complete